MSKVYVMQEFPNRTNACQKVHLKRSFGCITQAIVLSSNSSSGLWEVISPEITIAIGLQLLGLGASYIILTSAYGVSASSVFVARSLSVNAANLGQELKIAFPDGKADLNALQNDFKQRVYMASKEDVLDVPIGSILKSSILREKGRECLQFTLLWTFFGNGLNIQAA